MLVSTGLYFGAKLQIKHKGVRIDIKLNKHPFVIVVIDSVSFTLRKLDRFQPLFFGGRGAQAMKNHIYTEHHCQNSSFIAEYFEFIDKRR